MDDSKEEARLTNRKPNPTATPVATTGKFGASPKCARCGKSVFANEKVSAGNKDYHQACFKCKMCGKRMDATTMTEHNEDIYCKTCYGKHFGPKGVGFGLGGTGVVMHTEGGVPGQEPVKSDKAERDEAKLLTQPSESSGGASGTARFCSSCGGNATGLKFCGSCGTKVQ